MKKKYVDLPIEKIQGFVYTLLKKTGPLFYCGVSKTIQREFKISKIHAGYILNDMSRINLFFKYPNKKMHTKTVIWNQPRHRIEAVPMYIKWLRKEVPPELLEGKNKKIHDFLLRKVEIMRNQSMTTSQISSILDIPTTRVIHYIEELIGKGRTR